MSSAGLEVVVASGPRLGERGGGRDRTASTPRLSVASGGIACIVSVGVIAAAFPEFVRYDADKAAPIEALPEPATV